MSSLCTGIDVDIDVEHEGQRTKVTPPTQSGGGEKDVEMSETSSENGTSSEGGASTKGGASNVGGAGAEVQEGVEMNEDGERAEGGGGKGSKVSSSPTQTLL